jgi:hypothetical protein
MDSRNRIRLGALLAATVVTAGLAAALGPLAGGIDHLLRHGFASLSPQGRAIAIAIGDSLPYWLPATVIALSVAVASGRRQRREDGDGVDAHRGAGPG